MIASLVLLSSPAHAILVTRQVEICVNYDTEYDDVGNEDFWVDNNVDRWARGVEIEVVDETSSTTLNVSHTTGCANLSVDVETPKEKFKFKVFSRAEVQGVDYEVHEHLGVADWSNQPIKVETFTASATEVNISRTTSPALAWQVMGAISWMFHRSRFGINNGVNRSCCLEGPGSSGAALDGTCSDPNFEYGAPSAGTLHYFIRSDAAGCGGGNNQPNNHLNSVEYIGGCRSKFLYAHENGHLIVGMRMNGLEEYDLNADLDQCMGDFWAPGSPIDVGGSTERGMMTKEYSSDAIREGWGEFYSMWAWNSKNGGDCTFFTRYQYIDIDLNGTLDNDFAPSSIYNDWELDCAGTPWMGTDPPGNPTDGFNWLDDLEAAADPAGCVRDPLVLWGEEVEHNRAAVWDVARAFWDLHSNPGSVSTTRLSDLYVDACPRGWAQNDVFVFGPPAQPLNRLYTSSAFHSSTQTVVDNALDDHLLH